MNNVDGITAYRLFRLVAHGSILVLYLAKYVNWVPSGYPMRPAAFEQRAT